MNEKIELLVQELNKGPFNKNYSFDTFNDLEPLPTLQLLSDIKTEIDPNYAEATNVSLDEKEASLHLFDWLQAIGYMPSIDECTFKACLSQGNKPIVHDIMEWLFKNFKSIKSLCKGKGLEKIAKSCISTSQHPQVHGEQSPSTSLQPNLKTNIPVGTVKPVKSNLMPVRKCPVRGCSAELTRAHAFAAHLPQVFHTELTGEDISLRRTSALKLLSRQLLGGRSTMIDLVRYLESNGLMIDLEIDEGTRLAMTEFCTHLYREIPDDLNIRQVGNTATALLHWRVLIVVMAFFTDQKIQEINRFFMLHGNERELIHPVAFDSHCHLGHMAMDMGMHISFGVNDLIYRHVAREPYEVMVDKIVGVFSDPNSYPTIEDIDRLSEQNVIVAIGIDPKKSISNEEWQTLGTLLEYQNIEVFGDVGLDLADSAESLVEQVYTLQKVLQHLREDHILMVHASGPQPDFAILSLMFQLQSHQKVRHDHLIHFHCFSGSTRVLGTWLDAFPNTYIGVSRKLRELSAAQQEAIREIDRGRLLLETDAPLNVPTGYRRSSPSLLGVVASEVGDILDIPWKELISLTKENAEVLYSEKRPPQLMYREARL